MPLGVVDEVVEDVLDVVDDVVLVEDVAVVEEVELVLEVDELELVDVVVLDVDDVVVWCPWGGDQVRRACVGEGSIGRAMAAATPRVGTVSAAMTPSTRPYLGTETVLIEEPHDLPARRRLAPRRGLRAGRRRHFPPIGPIRPEVSSAR